MSCVLLKNDGRLEHRLWVEMKLDKSRIIKVQKNRFIKLFAEAGVSDKSQKTISKHKVG